MIHGENQGQNDIGVKVEKGILTWYRGYTVGNTEDIVLADTLGISC